MAAHRLRGGAARRRTRDPTLPSTCSGTLYLLRNTGPWLLPHELANKREGARTPRFPSCYYPFLCSNPPRHFLLDRNVLLSKVGRDETVRTASDPSSASDGRDGVERVDTYTADLFTYCAFPEKVGGSQIQGRRECLREIGDSD